MKNPTTSEDEEAFRAATERRRRRLDPLLEQMDAAKESTFLDLCELLLMLSERVEGSIKWNHPRVLVHIKQRKAGASPMSRPSQLWWLSYAGEEGSRGVVLCEGESFLHACQRSHQLGLSPGGEVKGFLVPEGEWSIRCAPFVDKLSTREKLEASMLAVPGEEIPT